MALYKVTDTELSAIADSIRQKIKSEEHLEYPEGFIEAIDSIGQGSVAVLIDKVIAEKGTYLASDDNADGYSSVDVDVNPGLVQRYAYDLLGGYVYGREWKIEVNPLNFSDAYKVTPGVYFISLGSTVGTRFRAIFSTQDTTLGEAVTGTQIVNNTSPTAYMNVVYTVPDNGYITITKDNAGASGLNSYVYRIQDLVDEVSYVPSGNQDVSTLDSYDVEEKSTARISSTERSKIIPGNIKKDVEILGVTGICAPYTLPTLFKPVAEQSNNEVTFDTNPSNGDFNVMTTATVDGVAVTSPLTVTSELDGKYLIVESTADGFEHSTRTVTLEYVTPTSHMTFTCTAPFTLKTKSESKTWDGTLEYSTDEETWSNWDGTEIQSNNNLLYLRGKGNTVITGSTSYEENFVFNTLGDITIFGNFGDLVDCETLAQDGKVQLGQYCFSGLFSKCTQIVSVEATLPKIKFPLSIAICLNMFRECTRLSSIKSDFLIKDYNSMQCYKYMFSGCTSLVTAPEIKMDYDVSSSCYYGMFEGCTSLVNVVEELPGKNILIDSHCYAYMFKGCTSLVNAPRLPATTVYSFCYYCMFSGCTSLVVAPELPATTIDIDCYFSMFEGCTNLTTPPSSLPALSLKNSCYAGMFQGCTSLTSAPSLPATKLASTCYAGMFLGCTSLTSAPELPATMLAEYCYERMFQSCTSLVNPPSSLPAMTLVNYCYAYMFNNCTSLDKLISIPATKFRNYCCQMMYRNCPNIKLSTEETDVYKYEYRIPSEGTGTGVQSSLMDMFRVTGGTFTGTPSFNTTYYTSNAILPVSNN